MDTDKSCKEIEKHKALPVKQQDQINSFIVSSNNNGSVCKKGAEEFNTLYNIQDANMLDFEAKEGLTVSAVQTFMFSMILSAVALKMRSLWVISSQGYSQIY